METTSTEKPAVTRFGATVLAAYALSFALPAVVDRSDVSVPGAYCAYLPLLMLVGAIVTGRLFEGKPLVAILIWTSGLINIVFLAALAVRWRSGNGRAFKVLRTTTLLMIPSCWMVFSHEHLYPQVGHVVWVVAMVLALFS